MHRRAVVGVDHVASGAAAVSIVARMVVGARHGKYRIQQASLLQTQKHGVGAKLGAKSAFAQLHIRLAGCLSRIWIAKLRAFTTSALEHAQHVAGLRNFPTRQRIEVRKNAFCVRLILRRRRMLSLGGIEIYEVKLGEAFLMSSLFHEVEEALAHLGLGRAYALQGDNGKAKAAYQDFFAVWKDADPDVPVLKTAKAEYEKLK